MIVDEGSVVTLNSLDDLCPCDYHIRINPVVLLKLALYLCDSTDLGVALKTKTLDVCLLLNRTRMADAFDHEASDVLGEFFWQFLSDCLHDLSYKLDFVLMLCGGVCSARGRALKFEQKIKFFQSLSKLSQIVALTLTQSIRATENFLNSTSDLLLGCSLFSLTLLSTTLYFLEPPFALLPV